MGTPGIAAVGIFVGGRASRMGGRPKGLLVTPSGETIVERLARIARSAGVALAPVLVGANEAYASAGLTMLRDDPSAEGPLAGLLALLAHARGGTAIALACDMPFVSEALLASLVTASASHEAPIVAARRDGRWEPFFARYDATRVLPVARDRAARGEHALQGLLAACGARELAIDPARVRELDDWDTEADVTATRG